MSKQRLSKLQTVILSKLKEWTDRQKEEATQDYTRLYDSESLKNVDYELLRDDVAEKIGIKTERDKYGPTYSDKYWDPSFCASFSRSIRNLETKGLVRLITGLRRASTIILTMEGLNVNTKVLTIREEATPLNANNKFLTIRKEEGGDRVIE